ncbi:hypothetical protein [Polaromonas sp.]|nr:hypothetical protein [Polaromonas sp.]MDI1273512.1 hypothetical protein [Polaromonas sp.]
MKKYLRPGSIEDELPGDRPGFDRSQLPEARRITAFFHRHLLP